MAPQEVVALLELGGRRAGMHAEGAGIEPLGEALDDGPLAGRVPPLEHHHGGDLGLQERVLEAPEPLLEVGKDALILGLGEERSRSTSSSTVPPRGRKDTV